MPPGSSARTTSAIATSSSRRRTASMSSSATSTTSTPRKRMKTIDDEVVSEALRFMTRAKENDTPFFVWLNTTHMHFRTHVKDGSRAGPREFLFLEQRATGTLRVWAEPYTELRMPKIFNLKTDPFERAEPTTLVAGPCVAGHPCAGVRRPDADHSR